jgi:hypothetical protein
MSIITVSDLQPNLDRSSDSEDYRQELSDLELSLQGGGGNTTRYDVPGYIIHYGSYEAFVVDPYTLEQLPLDKKMELADNGVLAVDDWTISHLS